jgi:hypothetical protein
VRNALDFCPMRRKLGDALNDVHGAFARIHGKDPPAELVERLHAHCRPDAANARTAVQYALANEKFFNTLALLLADLFYQAFGYECAAEIVVHKQNQLERPFAVRTGRLGDIGQARDLPDFAVKHSAVSQNHVGRPHLPYPADHPRPAKHA